jgi:uncharacterized repeat protein (TIGR01451 family)
VVTVLTENNHSRGGSNNRSSSDTTTASADVVIEKSASQSYAAPGDTVGYTVTITNYGGPIYDATLYDTLYDNTGTTTLERSWPLSTIASEESITVTYDVQFATSTTLGTHLNRAYVQGYHTNSNRESAEIYNSMVATVPMTLTDRKGDVLGAATTSVACDPYLTSYLKQGANNDADQVRRLQVFFNTFTSSTVPISGVFDLTSQQATRAFQQEYRSEILDPWGLTRPTGYVYYTT